jgi:hypothetical protein
MTYAGQQEWVWTANFEAFDAFPAEIGSTPAGTYRFAVEGSHRTGAPSANVPYELKSDEFVVSPWDGLTVNNFTANDGYVSFDVDSTYPTTYTSSAFPYVAPNMKGDELGGQFCYTCSFRPWAKEGIVQSAVVTIQRGIGATLEVAAELGDDGKWHLSTPLVPGDVAYVAPGGVVDNYGETNSEGTSSIELPLPPHGDPHGLAMPVL